MSKFSRAFVLVFGVDILVFLAGRGSYESIVLLIFIIPIELLVGLLLVFYKDHRETGAALLAAGSVTLLVAVVCSGIR